MTPRYPRGAVLALLDDAFTPPTRAAWAERLAQPRVEVAASFTPEAFATLRAAAARLVPAPDGIDTDLAGALDRRLASGVGRGWRYDVLPADGAAYAAGLAALEASARAADGVGFEAATPERQDSLLGAVQRGAAPDWRGPDQRRWFELLLVELTELHVAHPAVQDAMGVAASADAPGWTRIGLGDREPREPAPL